MLPAFIAALLRRGPQRLLMWQRTSFCKHFEGVGKNQQERETALIHTFLQGHPGQTAALHTLGTLWGRPTNDDDAEEEVPDEIQALTAAALQEMDPEQQEEFKEERSRYGAAGSKAANLANELLQARKQNIRRAAVEQETGHQPDSAMAVPPLEAPTPFPASTPPLVPAHQAVASAMATHHCRRQARHHYLTWPTSGKRHHHQTRGAQMP
jgi:hypothetical protein